MKRIVPATASVAAMLLLAGCATSSSGEDNSNTGSAQVVDVVDITQLCGDEEIQIALADGAAGHTWRKIVLEEFKDEASKCENITDVFYSDAGNDPQKAAADISGFVAQGVDVIVALADHGDAMLPAFREAHEAGVTLISYYVKLDGEAGVDFTEEVYVDSFGEGVEMGEWVVNNAEPGNVILVSGIASNPSAHEMFAGAKTIIDEHPDYTMLGDTFVVTDYNPEIAERAVAGLINQHGNITAVISEYGVVADAALAAFSAANLEYPALANSTGQNSMYCTWWDREEAGNGYNFSSWEGSTQVVRAALRHGMAAHNNIEYTGEPTSIVFDRAIDTPEGVLPPECDTSLPADADMFTGLTRDQLVEIMG